MNYADMSDFEINKAVGEIALEGKWACKPGHSGNESDLWYYGSVDTFVTPYCQLPDYCNSWADAGPIIMGNKICLSCYPHRNDWDAFTLSDKGYAEETTYDENPLRAAMIVFLMMQEGK